MIASVNALRRDEIVRTYRALDIGEAVALALAVERPAMRFGSFVASTSGAIASISRLRAGR
jgi:hypothetical protein